MTSHEELLTKEFLALGDHFPDSDLVLREVDGACWEISGTLKFLANYKDHKVHDEFEIQILIPPKYPINIPAVKEIGNRIPCTFHTYADRSLCLGAPLSIIRDFDREPTLGGFIKNCLIPFLYSFSFNEKYGHTPYGELSHGDKGILEYYQEVFDCLNARIIVELLTLLVEDGYSGQANCPCGSGERLRNCHGPILLELEQFKLRNDFHRDRLRIAKYTYFPHK